MSERVPKRKQRAAQFRAAAKSGDKFVKAKMPEEEFMAKKAEKAQKAEKRKEEAQARLQKESKENEKRAAEGEGGGEEQNVGNKKKRKRQAEDGEVKENADAGKDIKEEKNRFILFVGNLPYSATTESLREHLVASRPDALRLPTDKATNKVKGYAFAEFFGADATKRMKVCLRLHHSDYGGRKINVELTAGGGGKSVNRMQKLKEKNERLAEERREIQEHAKKPKTVTETDHGPGAFVHPSRLAQVNR